MREPRSVGRETVRTPTLFSYVSKSNEIIYRAKESRLANCKLYMVVRHRMSTPLSQSGNVCRHCGKNYWESLPACPYCGFGNRERLSSDEPQSTIVDPRKYMKLLSNNFYYVFLFLSTICAILIFIHDVPENMANNFGDKFENFQRTTRYFGWILDIIQQIMFCYWLMKHYEALSSLRIRKRFSSLMAWTTFIPLLNLYFPQAMVQELEDRLYTLKVPRLNIRFVPIWWFFQSIAFLYMLACVCNLDEYLIENGLLWLIIVIELIWAVAIFCQGYLLYGFMSAMNSVRSNSRRHASRERSSSSSSARRARHRRL